MWLDSNSGQPRLPTFKIATTICRCLPWQLGCLLAGLRCVSWPECWTLPVFLTTEVRACTRGSRTVVHPAIKRTPKAQSRKRHRLSISGQLSRNLLSTRSMLPPIISARRRWEGCLLRKLGKRTGKLAPPKEGRHLGGCLPFPRKRYGHNLLFFCSETLRIYANNCEVAEMSNLEARSTSGPWLHQSPPSKKKKKKNNVWIPAHVESA